MQSLKMPLTIPALAKTGDVGSVVLSYGNVF